MIGMNQTTVGRVLTWLADATGKDAVCDRVKLVELMNDIRQLAWSNRQVAQLRNSRTANG